MRVKPMKMSKTMRKMNAKLEGAIKKVNDLAIQELAGFSKLEHIVKFDLFPGSLLVTCYFESQQQLEVSMKLEKEYQKKLQKLLLKQGIVLKDVKQNLKFSTL
jgi:hypothetical protein